MKKLALTLSIFVLFFTVGCNGDNIEETTTEVITTETGNILMDYVTRKTNGGLEIVSYIGNDIVVEIPIEINGLPILKIGNYAFSGNQTIKSISLSSGILEIGSYAFSNMPQLISLEISDSVQMIGEGFQEKSFGLEEIKVVGNNENFYVENGILFHWVNQEDIKLKLNETTETEKADSEIFAYPSGKKDTIYEIPDSVIQIADFAFKGNQYLEEIIIPNTVTEIGAGTFMHVFNLKTLRVPGSVSVIPLFFCYGCESLEDLTIEEGVSRISNSAFEGCSSLINLIFPDSLVQISSLAFASIGEINEIYLNDNIRNIDGSVFAFNYSLTKYVTNESNKYFTVIDGVLYSKDLLTIVSYPAGKTGITYEVIVETEFIGPGVFESNLYLEEITYAGIITKIAAYAFSYTKSLKKVIIPENIECLSYYTFYSSLSIEEFVIDPNNIHFEVIDGIVFSEDLSVLYFYPKAKSWLSYTIPETVETIYDLAFFENLYLESVTVSKNVSQIKGGAFAFIKNLVEINVVEENLNYMSKDGILYSKDMTMLHTIPSGLEIETFEIKETVTEIYYGAFEGNPYLKRVIIPNTVTKINSYAFQNCENLQWIVIPASVEVIAHNIVYNSLNVVVYFEGEEDDYILYRSWNLDNRPYYFGGEWIFNEDNNPRISNNETIIDNETSIINDEIYLALNNGQDTVEINSEWIDAGALFVDNDETYEMTTEDTIDITTLGLYEIEYTYVYEEVTYTIVRYVIVVDQTPPEIELNLGVDTIKVGEEWTDAGVTITDNSGEDITAVITGEVDNTTPGTYTITYTATDSNGNELVLIRFVTVIE